MASNITIKGPKPWMLQDNETFESFSKWSRNMTSYLSKQSECLPFISKDGRDKTWQKTSGGGAHRGLTDDAGVDGTKKGVKLTNLTSMLDQIAQWAPHYLYHEIVDDSTSIESVWQIIRSYYHIQQSEVQFLLGFTKITWEGPGKESPERLYRRIMSHLDDNLLKQDSKLHHNGARPTSNEVLGPMAERLAVIHWLTLLDTRLPQLVARTHAFDLQTKTLKDIQPQIALGLGGFFEELRKEDAQASYLKAFEDEEAQASHVTSYTNAHEDEEAQASRVFSKFKPRQGSKPTYQFQQRSSYARPDSSKPSKPTKQCRLCRAEGRSFYGHTMSTCGYVGNAERRDMAKSYKVDTTCHDALDERMQQFHLEDDE